MPDARTPSSLLEYLPEIYGEDEFLGRYLAAFEKILLGRDDGVRFDFRGLEQIVAGLDRYFTPQATPAVPYEAPKEFLPWLSGWVALTLRADLDELRQRDFISRAVSLYRLRGTKRGIAEAVQIYTRLGVTIDESSTAFQIADHSTVGVDTFLGGGAPHYFRVLTRLSTTDPAQLKKQTQVVTDIINMEKPAHTHFVLEVETPALRIGVHSTVGVDTLLGGPRR
jgi:phage tail-like protein